MRDDTRSPDSARHHTVPGNERADRATGTAPMIHGPAHEHGPVAPATRA